jgi:hypothetical protein
MEPETETQKPTDFILTRSYRTGQNQLVIAWGIAVKVLAEDSLCAIVTIPD